MSVPSPPSAYTLDDFRQQLSQIARLSPIQKIISLIPGMSGLNAMIGDADPDQVMKRLFGIIDSMTPDERSDPLKQIDQSRRYRIAFGAGVELNEVHELVKQFDAMSQMMTSMAGKGIRERIQVLRRQTP